MRKSFLIFLLALLLLVVPGCGNTKGGKFKEASDKLIIPNLPVKEVKEEEYFRPVKLNGLPANYSIINSYYRKYGLVVLQNDSGDFGFYSETNGGFIVNCEYNSYNYNYRIIQDELHPEYMYLIAIYSTDSLKIYDNLGNLVYRSSEVNEVNYVDNIKLEAVYNNEKSFFCFSVLSQYFYYSYDESGNLFKEEVIPNVNDEGSNDSQNKESSFKVGDLFNNMGSAIDLTDAGYSDYKITITKEGYVYVYKNGALNKTYYADLTNLKAMIKDSFILQSTMLLPNDAKDYDLIVDGEKYALKTTKINIFTGKETEVKFDYFIIQANPFKDEDGLYTLALAKVAKINEYKMLEAEHEYVMNNKLNFVKDLTNQYIYDFVNFGDNYYNTTTGQLINQNYKFITNLSSLKNVKINEYGNFMIASYNGKYGIIDSNGIVVEEFIYDEIINNKESKVYILRVGENYKIKCEGRLLSEFNSYVRMYTSGKYTAIYNENFVNVIDENSLILDIYGEGLHLSSVESIGCYNDTSIIKIMVNGKVDGQYNPRYIYQTSKQKVFHGSKTQE